MRKYLKLSLVLSAVLMTGCQTYQLEQTRSSLRAQQGAELITRSEVMAVVSSSDIATDLEEKAAHWGYDLKTKERLPSLGLYVLTFDCPPGIDPHVASVELEKLQPESTVEALHKYTLQADLNETLAENLSGPLEARLLATSPLKYANGLIEWPANGCTAYKKIGIIDGGVNVKTASLAHVKISSKAFLSGPEAKSAVAHGTAIAELLAGPGRLRNAQLYSASVIIEDENGDAYTGVKPMLQAIDWMVKSGVGIVNISLAGPYNRTLDRGIQRAVDKGLIVVAAVGNAGADASPQYPAALKSVIATTAVDKSSHIYSKAVHGRHVDVAAPGVEVFVGEGEEGRYVSGTSIATPFVVAKIASNKEFSKARGPADIRALLSKQAADLGDKGKDPIFGAGLIQSNRNCTF